MSSGSPSLQASNDGDATQRVEPHGQLGPVLGREERVDVEHAELAQRRRLDLADQRRPGRGPGPRATRSRSGWRAGRARGSTSGSASIPTRPSRLVTMPSISSRSVSASVSQESLRRAQRADDVERHAGLGAGRVDRTPSARLPMSPLGSRISVGMPGGQRLLEQHDAEPGLARAGHAHDHAVGGEVRRSRSTGAPSAVAPGADPQGEPTVRVFGSARSRRTTTSGARRGRAGQPSRARPGRGAG